MEGFISTLWSFMGAFALFQTFLPPPLRQYLDRLLAILWEKLFSLKADSDVELQVEEKVDGSHNLNVFYRQVGVYLSSLRSSIDTHSRLKVCRSLDNGNLSFSLPDNEALEDSFEGAHVWWTHTCKEKEGGKDNGYGSSDERSFTLRFLRAERSIIMPAYLDHVSKISAEMEHKNTQRSLYTNSYGSWTDTLFNHPSTFDTLALDDGLAERIKADLDAFSKGKSFYRRIGRAWKRGYLLFGPPGTGKSSMIAAIAKHMEYDIYDLELTKVCDNAELKSLLMETSRKSVIVIEDIDCSVQLSERKAAEGSDESSSTSDGSKLTLSGLLNFSDGLWSCCGEERIFIFTTNHKDKLDPALLRPGRMDMHILLGYCTFPALKKLASSYLGIQEHPMYADLEKALTSTPHQITPAAMAEMLISNQSDPDAAFKQVMAALRPSSTAQEVIIDNNAHEVLPLSAKKTSVKKSRLLRGRRALFFLRTTIEGFHD